VAPTGNEDVDAILHSLQLCSDAMRCVSTIDASSGLGASISVVSRLAACTLEFTRALEQEAIRLSAAQADERLCAAEVHTAFAAVRSQVLATSTDASALHPLLADIPTSAVSLNTLDRIPEMAAQEEERVRKAGEALRSLDFQKLHEDRWQEHARQRDDGRLSFLHLQQCASPGCVPSSGGSRGSSSLNLHPKSRPTLKLHLKARPTRGRANRRRTRRPRLLPPTPRTGRRTCLIPPTFLVPPKCPAHGGRC
jgi:galactokinase